MNRRFFVTCVSAFVASATIVYADSIPKLVERRIDMHYPDQLSRDTTITFTLEDTCDLVIVAYGMNGLPLDTIEQSSKGPGTHTVVWKPRSGLPAGKYHVELLCGDLRLSQGVLYGDYVEPYSRADFSPDSTIAYVLKDTCAPVIVISNVLGQPVDTIVQEITPPGRYRHVWRPQKPVPSGIYFWHLRCGTQELTRHFMWLPAPNSNGVAPLFIK